LRDGTSFTISIEKVDDQLKDVRLHFLRPLSFILLVLKKFGILATKKRKVTIKMIS
jgi:hypothetical protein